MILVLHSTESDNGTGRAVADYLAAKGYQSHWVYDPQTREEIALLSADVAAKSLVNLPGGVETNRLEVDGIPGPDVLQVEIVHRAGTSQMDEWWINLRRWLRAKCHDYGIPYVFPVRFANTYSDARNVRLTPAQWEHIEPGIYGHCHVPEQDPIDPQAGHWDPGPLRMDLLNPPELAPYTPPLKKVFDMILISLNDGQGNADVAAGVFLHSGDALRWIRNGDEYAALKRAGVPESLCSQVEIEAIILELHIADQCIGDAPTSGPFKGAWTKTPATVP